MGLKIYNTMSRRKEEFEPGEKGKVRIYTCGPTVYNYIHIGNARTFLNFDMIRRYLEYSGFEVKYVQNVTDVDDKIINRAADEGMGASELATRYLNAFNADMAKLGVRPPDIAPKATEHIADMLKVIGGLVDQGYAYESEGDIYFDVSKFEKYGTLSGRDLEEQQVTSQCNTELARKRNAHDFALWKASKPGEPSWESPWGPGRPGWHIECSTMSVKYLGDDFDIHGGGQDLIFPHHENEIAQAEAYSGGVRFAKYWMHSGMLNIDREKMSKSLGNIKGLGEVLEEYDPETVRMLMLGTHYRNPLNFSDDALKDAHASLERIKNCFFNIDDILGRLQPEKGLVERTAREVDLENFLRESDIEFRESMDDDFNSAAALGAVFGIVREVNAYLGEVEESRPAAASMMLNEARRVLAALCGTLGLVDVSLSVSEILSSAGQKSAEEVQIANPLLKGLLDLIIETSGLAGEELKGHIGRGLGNLGIDLKADMEDAAVSLESLIELLIETRALAKGKKDYHLADRIRERLLSLGIRLEDGKEGTRWKLES